MTPDLRHKLLEPTEENLALAARCVLDGGVIIAPSDTNVALTLSPWSDAAIDRAFAIKNRPPTSPLTLFIAEPLDWRRYGSAPDDELVDAFAREFWPGPLNIVVRRNDRVTDKLVCGGDSVSVGCVANPTLQGLLRHMDAPVAMTSANLSGMADNILVDLDLALEQVGGQVDFILLGSAQNTTKSSTIIDLSGEPRVLRSGDITLEQLSFLADVFGPSRTATAPSTGEPS